MAKPVKTIAVLLVTAVATLTLGVPVATASPGKIVVIVMENEGYSRIVGSSKAPYVNSLIPQGDLFRNYTAITNGSLHNYLAMTSGLTLTVSPPSPNVFQAIDATGGAETWTSFEESMSANCGAGSTGSVPGTTTPLYARLHDPAYQYRGNETCKQNDVPMTSASFDPSALPDLSFVVPNQCDNMHTLPAGGAACPAYFGDNTGSTKVAMGDHWLSVVVPQLLAQPDVTVVLTWDEGNRSTGEHIVTLEVGAGVTPGSSDATAYDHYGLEAGLYAALGLGTAPNFGATATPLPIP